jgi:hypothetical protein
MKKLKKIMSKITETSIRVLTIAGYVSLGIVIASILIYLMSDLTITNKSEVDQYDQIKDRAINEMMDQSKK